MDLIDDPFTRRAILKRQEVRRERVSPWTRIWKVFTFFFSCFFKFSCLLMILVAVSLAFITLYDYLLRSPYIRLEKVVVTGVDEEVKEELLELAKLDFEMSLLAINLGDLKRKLEQHPWIRSIEVEKTFPHTLTVRAEKQEPWAIVAGEKLHYMNRWGKVFKEVDVGESQDFPIITGIPADGDGKARLLNMAVSVLSTLEAEKGRWSLAHLSEVHVREEGSVHLYYASLPVAIKASARGLGGRMEDLNKVVEHLTRTGRIRVAKGINLEYKDGAVVSFRKG